MQETSLPTPPAFDLGLLRALDVFLNEESVTDAANVLHLSVPAASRQLSRIRRALGDPLLVRAGKRMVLTEHARRLRPSVRALVEDATSILGVVAPFAPASFSGTFTIRCADAAVAIVGVGLTERLSREAPAARLRFLGEGNEDARDLRDGAVDVDVGALTDFGPEFLTGSLVDDRFVAVISSGHPLVGNPLTPRRLASCRHVAVSRHGRFHGPIDDALSHVGMSRDVGLVVPTFSAALMVAATSELIASVPSLVAHHAATVLPLEVLTLPFDLPKLTIAMHWHPRSDRDEAQRWFRQLIRESVSGAGLARA